MYKAGYYSRYIDKLIKSQYRGRLLGVLIVISYFYLMYKTIGVRPDHFFLSTLVLVFILFGKSWGRTFLIDWAPFIIFWIAYDMMRGVADSIRGYIFDMQPYDAEEFFLDG